MHRRTSAIAFILVVFTSGCSRDSVTSPSSASRLSAANVRAAVRTTEQFSATAQIRDLGGSPSGRCGPTGTDFSGGTGSGTIGRFTVDASDCPTGGADIVGGQVTFTTTSGDQLFATYAGGYTQISGNGGPGTVISIDLNWQVTGGTGSFAACTTGGGTAHATFTLPDTNQPNHFVFKGQLGC